MRSDPFLAEVLARWARAIPEVRSGLVKRLGARDRRTRRLAAFSLARAGVCAGTADATALVEVLSEILGDEDSDRRWAAEAALARLGRTEPGVVEQLRAVVASGRPIARKMAIYALRDLGWRARELGAQLLGCLGDGDAEIRLAALSALAELCPDEAEVARAMAEVVRADQSPGVRRAAASALGKLRPPPDERAEVVRLLEAAAGSEDEGLGRAARGALRRLAPEKR